jgi:hypothetical protein
MTIIDRFSVIWKSFFPDNFLTLLDSNNLIPPDAAASVAAVLASAAPPAPAAASPASPAPAVASPAPAAASPAPAAASPAPAVASPVIPIMGGGTRYKRKRNHKKSRTYKKRITRNYKKH